MRIAAWVLALAVSAPAFAQEGGTYAQPRGDEETPSKEVKHKKKKDKDEEAKAAQKLDVDLRAQLYAGAFSGLGVRHDAGALLEAEVAADVDADAGPFHLSIPLRAGHRQTIGAWLPETSGRAGIAAGLKPMAGLRVDLAANLLGAWRPGWADLYQPISTGVYRSTDRFSFLGWNVGARGLWKLAPQQFLRFGYRLVGVGYVHDANFDASADPMHIAPQDHFRNEVELVWRYSTDTLRFGAGVEAMQRNDLDLYSRDALTGLTHSNPGGLPPNPLQVLRSAEPVVDLEVELGPLEVDAHYGYEMLVDSFQGYYSYSGHDPKLALVYTVSPRSRIRVAAEASFRDYGPDSYAAGTSRPPLDSGTHRTDRKFELSVGVDWALWQQLAATFDAKYVNRDTNYPNYVPSSFPSTAAYDIQWDYVNWEARVGIAYRL